MAYSVEKLGFTVILVNSGQLAQANSLNLLDVDFSEMSKLLRKGVFQQNRPLADPRCCVEVVQGFLKYRHC